MAKSLPDTENDDLIRITHYINPHNFWFKHESSFLFNSIDQQFQLEINEYCENTFGRGNLSTGLYQPQKRGELVAVFYFQLGRWIRAEVDDIQHELNGQVQCNLWAIDEGVPIKTSCKYIKPLPERFASVDTNVKHGGLEGVLPAETVYDYTEGCSVTRTTTVWSPGIVRVFESCIEEAVSIRFCNLRRYKATGVEMYFGIMKITSHQNVTNNATDLLRKAGGDLVLLVGFAEFFDKFPLLQTQDMYRFEDNEHRENMKYFTNTFRPEYSGRRISRLPERHREYEASVIEMAREKFLEWDKRNVASSTVITVQPKSREVGEGAAKGTNTHKHHKRREQEHSYTVLLNESISEEDEEKESPTVEPPKQTSDIEIEVNPTFSTKPVTGIPSSTASSNGQEQGQMYDRDMADIAPALHKIKLRRNASHTKYSGSRDNGQNTSKTSITRNSTINIMPAGFSLGNVDFAAGSVILGEKPVSQARHNAYAKSDSSISSEGKLQMIRRKKKQRYHQLKDERESSCDEEIVRKHQMVPVQGAEEDDEVW